ncbi:MAG: DUF2206 domain-containing protein [Candidatus Bathyarchaeota archaeon]|nr:DUF2206 domain-containing protein [Candidatus Bathyarchaeota archaeon]
MRKKNLFIIPVFLTFIFLLVLFLNVPLLRDILVFFYLSFVPGFVIVKTFIKKEIGLIYFFLFSVGLSIFASMLLGLLVNAIYVFAGISKPLSVLPLSVVISVFTLIFSVIGYYRDFSSDIAFSIDFNVKRHLPLAFVLTLIPILGIVGALYINVLIMITLCIIIFFLCILCFTSNKLVPIKLYPFIIFSISISILLLNLLMSKYVIGDDANLEFFVFRINQIRGYWGPIDTGVNSWTAISYNSMLSVTLLPTFYSVLMTIKTEVLFKILYSFIFSLVPIALYQLFKRESSTSIGLLSALFFVFTYSAFFGELISVNRQIVSEFFLVLSILIWIDKALPINEKRLLLIVFGACIAVSHYSLAIIYLVFITLVVIISSIKSKFDDTFNAPTVLSIFGITFLWYMFSAGSTTYSTLNLIVDTIRRAFAQLTNFQLASMTAGNVSSIYGLPEVFTTASWINLVVTGLVTLSLAVGVIIVILLSRKLGISDKYNLVCVFFAVMFIVSYFFPSIAATLNFTRFYAITFLFLSICIPIGALSLIKFGQTILTGRGKNLKNNLSSLSNHGRISMFLVAILLGAYFLSQTGFVNYVTNGAIHSSTFDYYKIKTSSQSSYQIQFYESYTQDQDVSSAIWLSKFLNSSSSRVYSDSIAGRHVLVSQGLINWNRILYLTNTTEPDQGSLVYLSGLNIVNGLVPSDDAVYNYSEVSSAFKESHLIYSNGNSEIWCPPKKN